MIRKITTPWASLGDTGTPPTTPKQGTGFVRRDKGIRQIFNWLFNGIHSRINDLADVSGNIYDMTTAREWQTAAELHIEQWANEYGDTNSIDLGAGVTADDIATCFLDGVTYIIALDTAANEIYKINAQTGVVVGSSGNLDGRFSGTATVMSMCSDGQYAYVVARNTANAVMVAKISLSSTATIWENDAAWPSGGTTLTGTWTANGIPRVRVVDATHIAVACPWVTISADSSAAIQILSISDGGLVAVGAGNATTGNGEHATGEIASDGETIFFSTTGGTSPTDEFCQCTIADPTTGATGTGWPLDTNGKLYRCCNMGRDVVAVPDIEAPTASDIFAMRSAYHTAVFDVILNGTSDNGEDPESSHIAGCERVVFDGINVWISTRILVTATGYFDAIVGFDANHFRASGTSGSGTYQHATSFLKGPFFMGATTSGTHGQKIVFDGRDIWGCDGTPSLQRVVIPHRR